MGGGRGIVFFFRGRVALRSALLLILNALLNVNFKYIIVDRILIREIRFINIMLQI